MITEIYCDKFKEKKITFHEGLNVVLGDDAASNSIGKSTLLLVIGKRPNLGPYRILTIR